MRDQLRDLRLARASWRRRIRRGHAPVQRQLARPEAEAVHIVTVELFLVPGLVQTAEYARAVLASAAAEMAEVLAEPDTDAAVRARIRRQDVLYDPAKQIDIVVTETALRYRACPVPVLRGQLDRIGGLIGLSNVHIGIIPLVRQLPVVPLHGYLQLDDQIIVELNHTELTVGDPDEVAVYQRITDLLWTVAVEGDAARALLARIAADLAG
ncbi:MAG TPA: Scr1 family TA system antitoxin-like transcriptional regulator [Pseudonocardiaceae bacterium]